MRGIQRRCSTLGVSPRSRQVPFVKHDKVESRPVQSRQTKRYEHSSSSTVAKSSNDQVQLLQATISGYGSSDKARKLLVYLPGTDGTGNAISPQLSGLLGAGFDVRALYISITNRSDWDELTEQTIGLIRDLVNSHPIESKVTLTAESFGGCLALRCLAAAPELFERAVLVNPATCFAKSYGGLPNVFASLNLLSVFPEQLYQLAQAILIPFLVEQKNMGAVGLDAVRQMIDMSPPENRRVAELATEQGPDARSRTSLLQQLESHGPAAAGSWRLALLCSGNLPDATLAMIRTPTLLISSAKDRLLGSLQEGARLERVMANAMRVVLPRSGHTALLEADVNLINILQWANFLPADMAPEGIKTDHGDDKQTLQVSTASAASNGVPQLQASNGRQLTVGLQKGVNGYSQANGRHSKAALPRPPERVTAVGNNHSSITIASPEGLKEAPQIMRANGTDLAGQSYSGVPGSLQNGSISFADAATAGPSSSAPSRTLEEPDSPIEDPARKGSKTLQQQKRTPWSSPNTAFDQAISVLTPLRELISPVVHGVENLPSASETSRPLLLVGNHARIGLYDMPFLIIELYLRGVKVRGLAHPGHWKGPLGPIFEAFGAVKASPMSAYKLLKEGEAVLLFPGGGREVNKRRGEEYKLFWSEEPDFVRMAAKLNALIVPFASVGADEAYDIALDSEEVLRAPFLGDLMRRVMQRVDPSLDLSESVPPLTNLPGLRIPSLLPIPNLSRLYFRFMPPIDPARSGKKISKDGPEAQQIYAEVKQEVYNGISLLKKEQQTDPRNSLSSRFLEQFGRVFPAFDLLRR